MEQRGIYKSGIIVLMLCIIPIVYANDYFDIDTINTCYDNIQIEVQTDYNNYTIEGCTKGNRFWDCECKNPTVLQISLVEETNQQFDFIIWYYVQDTDGMTALEKDTALRKREMSDVVFKKPVPPSEPINFGFIAYIFIGIGIVGVVGMFFIGRHYYRKFKDD